jgi:hypothetical protein
MTNKVKKEGKPVAYPPEHNRSLKGVLADKITKTPGDRDWREIQEEAWRAAAEAAEAGSKSRSKPD